MEVNEQLVRAVTQAVVAQLMASGAQPQDVSSTPGTRRCRKLCRQDKNAPETFL